ncbi:Uncharacterized protein APZ42_005708 [Daphnia magna]|uniref:Uncharacterized protein n=1 Tax=Daphnia magna TaxID=35525 RepID=A0A164GAS4_9CRUS|nr:Uncharacterized protein APZ42_005708 [Daphnia magna]
MITSGVYWPAKSTHQFEWINRVRFRQCRPTAAPSSKNPSNLSAGDTPLPESVDYSLILPISGGPMSCRNSAITQVFLKFSGRWLYWAGISNSPFPGKSVPRPPSVQEMFADPALPPEMRSWVRNEDPRYLQC